MLTLSRRKGQNIVIGDNIVILVKDIRKGQVKLGIYAPTEICILRDEELALAIMNNASEVYSEKPDETK